MSETITGKCDSLTYPLEAENLPVPIDPNSGIVYPQFEESGPYRIGPLASTTLIHLMTDHPLKKCVDVSVCRVLTCPAGCDVTEYSYPFPCTCEPYLLLPAGTYDITVCRQTAAPLEAGEVLNLTFMAEPVTDTFANIFLGLTGCAK